MPDGQGYRVRTLSMEVLEDNLDPLIYAYNLSPSELGQIYTMTGLKVYCHLCVLNLIYAYPKIRTDPIFKVDERHSESQM